MPPFLFENNRDEETVEKFFGEKKLRKDSSVAYIEKTQIETML